MLIAVLTLIITGFVYELIPVFHPEALQNRGDNHVTTNTSLESAVIERIIDADTLVLVGGARVRLIGVDAPEMDTQEGQDARSFVETLLAPGQTIWLEADRSQSPRDIDRFGRLRRYVWLINPADPNDPQQRKNYTLNEILLTAGHAVKWP